jgi:shikimate dehydrogenase
MHNAALKVLGLDWRYLAFEVPPQQLRDAIAGARSMKFIGLNLTVPHKILAIDLVDVLDATSRTWGAVNTIRFEARDASGDWRPLGTLEGPIPDEIRSVGFNTDADAITRSLREDLHLEPRGASVLVLGAGGAGRTAALRLAAEGVARLHLVNRTADKAHAVAMEIRGRHPGVDVVLGYPPGSVDLVLNATSLGLKAADELPLDTGAFSLRRAGATYDMIYRPAQTPLLRLAGESGCRCANGLGMLLYQGARALELWTGRTAPLAVMRQALETNIYGPQEARRV